MTARATLQPDHEDLLSPFELGLLPRPARLSRIRQALASSGTLLLPDPCEGITGVLCRQRYLQPRFETIQRRQYRPQHFPETSSRKHAEHVVRALPEPHGIGPLYQRS